MNALEAKKNTDEKNRRVDKLAKSIELIENASNNGLYELYIENNKLIINCFVENELRKLGYRVEEDWEVVGYNRNYTKGWLIRWN